MYTEMLGNARYYIDDYATVKGFYHAHIEEGEVYARLMLQNRTAEGYYGLHQSIGRISKRGAMGKRQEARANALLKQLYALVLQRMHQAGWVEEKPLCWRKKGG